MTMHENTKSLDNMRKNVSPASDETQQTPAGPIQDISELTVPSDVGLHQRKSSKNLPSLCNSSAGESLDAGKRMNAEKTNPEKSPSPSSLSISASLAFPNREQFVSEAAGAQLPIQLPLPRMVSSSQTSSELSSFHPVTLSPLEKPSVNRSRPLLLLDLDETLIHSSTKTLPGLEEIASFADGKVYARPHLAAFLRTVAPLYSLGIWTAAGSSYASVVASAIFSEPDNLALVWSRAKCTSSYDPENGELRHLKDLKKIKRAGFDLGRTLLVDDIPANVRRHYGNHVRISPFTGDPHDSALLNLAKALSAPDLLVQLDFRRIEKRSWYRGPLLHPEQIG
jgi:TFIIF-interacting CTD phosphatase-like protein